MPIVVLLVGIALLVTTFRNTHGDLATALMHDVPGFAVWFVALALVGGIGYVPGMEKPSRYLLALVMTVLFLASYQQILTGFRNAASGAGTASAGPPDPAEAYAANPSQPNVTTASIEGTTGSTAGAGGAAVASNPFDPATYLQAFATSFGGAHS